MALDVWVNAPDAGQAQALVALLTDVGVAATVAQAHETVDWEAALRFHHQPVTIGNHLRLRPPWATAVPGLIDIVIDPGMAFGTGQHATTKGCLELLVRIPSGGSLLDAGCGSGVLAIAACLLGFSPVSAIDFDPLATEATAANAEVNGVRVDVAAGDLTTMVVPAAQTVVANLTATLLAAFAPVLARQVPERLIVSGINDHEVESTTAVFGALGLRRTDRVGANGWAALLLERE